MMPGGLTAVIGEDWGWCLDRVINIGGYVTCIFSV